MGLGGCTTFDVMSILKKTRQQVTDCVVELQGERADFRPLGIHLNSCPL